MSDDTFRLRGPIRFRTLLDEAVRFTRAHFMAIFPWVAIPMVVVGLIMVVVQVPLIRQMAQPATGTGALDLSSLVGAWTTLFAMTFVNGILYWFASNVALVGALRAASGLPVHMGSAWLWVLRPRVLGTMLLCLVAMLAGTPCCIFIGSYLVAALFGLLIPVMALEGSTGLAAIRRCTELILANPLGRFSTRPYLRLLAIMFVGFLISILVEQALSLPFAAAQQVIAMRSLSSGEGPPDMSYLESGTWLWLQIPQVILGTLGSHAVMIYVSFCVALFYLDLRFRGEGNDLEEALDEAGAPQVAADEIPAAE